MFQRIHKRRSDEIDGVELDMVPIMNMFLVIIPFLLMSASFFHLKAIRTSVPVLGSVEKPAKIVKEDKVTIILEITAKGFDLTAVSETLGTDVLEKLETSMKRQAAKEYPMDKLFSYLNHIKELYPKSDTMVIIPANAVIYDTIVKTMDVARYSNNTPMFPNVVLSGKIG